MQVQLDQQVALVSLGVLDPQVALGTLVPQDLLEPQELRERPVLLAHLDLQEPQVQREQLENKDQTDRLELQELVVLQDPQEQPVLLAHLDLLGPQVLLAHLDLQEPQVLQENAVPREKIFLIRPTILYTPTPS